MNVHVILYSFLNVNTFFYFFYNALCFDDRGSGLAATHREHKAGSERSRIASAGAAAFNRREMVDIISENDYK